MVRHIHIIPVGTNPIPSLGFIDSKMPLNKVCLICSDNIDNRVNTDIGSKLNESKESIIRTLKTAGREYTVVNVDPWNFQDILDSVLDFAYDEKERDPSTTFHINITSGTHVICAAVSSAAFFIGADLYYVMNNNEHNDIEDPVPIFQIPNLPDISNLKDNMRKTLLLLDGGDWVRNSDLLSEDESLTPSKLGYQTKVLKDYSLIECRNRGREVDWRLTYSGKVAIRTMGRPLKK